MSTLSTLRLFNEKAEKLDRLSFTRYLREESLGYDFQATPDGGGSIVLRGPSEESTDAFVLTLRLFVQNRDGISLQRMKELYESLPVSDVLKTQFAEAIVTMNAFLDSSRVTRFGEAITNRRVFDVFMYGGLAHANIGKKVEFDQWASNKTHFPMMFMLFQDILGEFLRFIFWCHEHNQLAIMELTVGGKSS